VPSSRHLRAIMMKLRFASMTGGPALGVTAAVLVACTVAAYVFSVHHFQSLLETEHTTALAEGELIRTARLISQGDLERRVPAEGSDTLAWMAREFNAMADSVSGLVGEVRTQRERLETVINSIDDGIVVLDAERKIMAANDAFLQRARSSREQVLGCCCYALEPGPCNLSDCPTLACLRLGARQIRICERKTGNDTVAWEEIHASPIPDTSGRLTQVVEVWRDISERRAAEAKLAESYRLASVGVLASGFSHEMNTPLATTLMCVEGILRETPPGQDGQMDQARIRENATIAREQILRCRGITQHFLRLSRGQRHAGDIVDLGAAIAATARANSVDVAVRPFATTLHVRADEAELQNLLVNLLLNAIQATKPGGVDGRFVANPFVVSDRVLDEYGRLIIGEFKTGDARKQAQNVLAAAATDLSLLDEAVERMCTQFLDTMPDCLTKTIESLRKHKLEHWDRTRETNRAWLSLNMMTEANAGFRAFHYGDKKNREVDFVRLRQRLAQGARWSEELIEEIAPWTAHGVVEGAPK